jgi:septal ring factor EnvC (AmiA/AmiB activator)
VLAFIQQFADRVDRRFEAQDRFEAIDRRLDRMSETLVGIQSQMVAMTKWSDRFDRDQNATLATQTAQQRAIDELSARVAKLEQQRKAS